MSDRKSDLPLDTELRPLREQLGQPGLDPDARRLGQALQGLYREAPGEADPAGWAALRATALRHAQRRQRRYHLWEAWRSLGALRFLAAGAAAAVPVLVAWLAIQAGHAGHHAPSLPVATAPREATPGPAHLALQATGAPHTVRLRCGAQLQLTGGHAEVDQEVPGQPRIQLQRGLLSVQVPHLPSGGRLVVATTDAEVIVHGTRFLVDRRQPEATTVSVQEGLVEVRPQGGGRPPVFLRAGERAEVPGAAAYAQALASRVEGLLRESRCDEAALDAYLDGAPAGQDTSAALYLKCSCAAARGEREAALACFERVAARTGSGLRADNALARAAQLREGQGRAAGASAWRGYLQRFPQGLHRQTALRYLEDRGKAPP